MTDSATGHLLTWSQDHAQVAGLAAVAFHDLVEIEGCGPALVTALRRDHVDVVPLCTRPPTRGALVRRVGPLVVPAGEDLFGRIVDSLGCPLDDGAPLSQA